MDGLAYVPADAPLAQPAMYVRGDTPVPLLPALTYEGEHDPDPLTILGFAGGGTGEAWNVEVRTRT